MGRKVRRVPLDFDAPPGETWKGFLNPHYRECPKVATNECHAGYSNAGKWLDAISRFIALVGVEAVKEPFADGIRVRGTTFPHPFIQGFALAPGTRDHLRLLPFTEEMVDFVFGLAGVKPDPKPDPMMLSDSEMGWGIAKTLRKAAGIGPDSKWGVCKVCGGHGIDPAVYKAWDEWEPEEPPVGEGWQLWETISEGSPISPVFATADDLIDWMSKPCAESESEGRGAYPDMPWAQGYKRTHAAAFVKGAGWAPSGVMIGGRMMSGVEGIAVMCAEKKGDKGE